MLRYKKQISAVSGDHCLENITQLTIEFLCEYKINFIALDFDGVLAAHSKPRLNKEVKIWLDNFARDFGQENIFILSNIYFVLII